VQIDVFLFRYKTVWEKKILRSRDRALLHFIILRFVISYESVT
jgi:hypothetical protein